VRVKFTTPARNDLDRIRIFIARSNPQAARRVIRAIRSAAEQLSTFPLMAPEADLPTIRVKLALPYPYLVFDTTREDTVLILHVRHAAQQLPSAADM
jgi:plasmid stabilization system protein ParE